MKKVLTLALAVALLVACFATATAEEEITLRMAWWGSQGRAEKTQTILTMFSEEHPGVSFEYEIYPSADNHNEMISTQAAANELPDVFQGGAMTLKQWVGSGMLLDLTPYIESGALDLSNVPEAVIDQGRVGDGIYCVTNGLNCHSLLYNATVAKEAGVEMPYGLSWDDFKTAARTVYEKTGMQVNFFSNTFDIYDYFARDAGYSLYADNALGIPDPTIMETVLQFYLDGVTEGWHLRPEMFVEITPGVPETDPLVTGGAWCTLFPSNQSGAVYNLVDGKFELGQTTFPADNPVQTYKVNPSQAFMISASTEHPDLCVELINNITNSVEWNKVLAADRGVPINGEVATAIMGEVDAGSAMSIELVNYVSQNCSPSSPTYPIGAEEVHANMSMYLDQVLYGMLTPAEAAEQLYDLASSILAQAY